MRIGVVVDSTCDLPARFFREHGIKILPITLKIGDKQLVDERDEAITQRFYLEHLDSTGINSESVPYSTEEIEKVFLERLVLDYDFVFCITVSSKHSLIFENAQKASFKILTHYRKPRADAGIKGPFSMRVLDSGTIFAGTALLAAEVTSMIEMGAHHNAARTQLEEMVPKVYGYMVPEDIGYVGKRGFRKAQRVSALDAVKSAALTVGSLISAHPVIRLHANEEGPSSMHLSYDRAVERMLTEMAERVRAGKLISRHVCLSYAGELSKVLEMPGYQELEAAMHEKRLTLLVSMMSATGAVNVGAGCLFVAFAGEE
jgi:DegV family protein with EDD domain